MERINRDTYPRQEERRIAVEERLKGMLGDYLEEGEEHPWRVKDGPYNTLEILIRRYPYRYKGLEEGEPTAGFDLERVKKKILSRVEEIREATKAKEEKERVEDQSRDVAQWLMNKVRTNEYLWIEPGEEGTLDLRLTIKREGNTLEDTVCLLKLLEYMGFIEIKSGLTNPFMGTDYDFKKQG